MIEQSLTALRLDCAIGVGEEDRISVMDEVLTVMRIDIQLTLPDVLERARSFACGGSRAFYGLLHRQPV